MLTAFWSREEDCSRVPQNWGEEDGGKQWGTQQHNEDGEDQGDAEEEDSGVYISVSGAGLRAKLNARDLRRIDKETEFDQRFESLKFLCKSLHYFLFRFSSDLLNGKNYSTIHMVLPTIKDINNHIDGFKKDKVIGETAKYLSKEFDNYFR